MDEVTKRAVLALFRYGLDEVDLLAEGQPLTMRGQVNAMLASVGVATAPPTRCGSGDLPSPVDAWARVVSGWRPSALPSEMVSLAEALDRVSAHAFASPINSPPFDRSAMDGYAVRAADLTGPKGDGRTALRMAGEVLMGRPPALVLSCGEAIRVPTGAMIPPGADAVVPCPRQAAVRLPLLNQTIVL